jgi:hypothetical protein
MPGGLQLFDILWGDFIAVTVSLPDCLVPTVEAPDLARLGSRFKEGRTKTKTHGTSKVGLGDLWHEDDHRMRR